MIGRTPWMNEPRNLFFELTQRLTPARPTMLLQHYWYPRNSPHEIDPRIFSNLTDGLELQLSANAMSIINTEALCLLRAPKLLTGPLITTHSSDVLDHTAVENLLNTPYGQ